MADVDVILDRARDWAAGRLAIATVINTWGSAPRPRGSHMLVHADGRFEGSVSGGCVEGAVLEAAGEVVETGESQRLRFGVADTMAWEVGLPCGGEIELLVQPVSPAGFPADLLEVISRQRANGLPATIQTDLATGQSMLAEDAVAEQPGTFVNRYAPPRRLLVVGAVQIAQSLAVLAQNVGFAVTVIDPRARFLTEERFPGVLRDDRWPDEAIAAARPDPSTAVVTLSHDIKIDDPALAAALQGPAFYIGALGSRRSHSARLIRLAERGFGDQDLARIEGPAGLPLGGIGASEIALSIAARLVERHRQAEPRETTKARAAR